MHGNKYSLPLWTALCVVFTVYLFFPGYMDNDAIDQFRQGVSGNFSDWSPPVMSWLWGRLNQALPGALGMLILHTALYWCGLGLWIALSAERFAHRFMFLLTGFFPPAFMLLGTIVKDAAMAVSLLFGFALIASSGRTRSLPQFFAGIAFLGYGMMIRHNAILAAAPLFLSAGFTLTGILSARSGRTFTMKASVLSGGLLFSSVLLLGSLADNRLTNTKTYPFQQILLHDLVGMSLKLKTYLVPEYVASSEQPSMKDLRRIYQPTSVKNLYWPDFTPIHYTIMHDPDQVKGLFDAWLRSVTDYPRAYLAQRSSVFVNVMKLRGGKNCAPYYYPETIYKPRGFYRPAAENEYYSSNPVTSLVFRMIEPLRNSLLYRNWLYLVLPLLLLAISLYIGVRQKLKESSSLHAALALSTSGLLYGAGYFFVATTCDFRMLHWNAVSSVAAGILLCNVWMESKRPSGAA
jgi:hypothetical protein